MKGIFEDGWCRPISYTFIFGTKLKYTTFPSRIKKKDDIVDP